jgi:ectoine hydroxylase-related dioxygenase (phytanoyl-CoA dioxygenase family)
VQSAFQKAQESKNLRNLLNQDDCFIDLVDHPAYLPIVRAIVGDDIQLRYINGGLVKPQSDSGSGWHCDLSQLKGVYLPEAIIMTKLFVYLEPVPENGACLACVPGSHRYEMGHPLPDINTHEDMPHHVKMIAQPGDAVLMNGYTWHARFHNNSDTPRRVIESSYIHAWMKTQFEFDDLSTRVQEQILSSHNRRQLFGVPEPGQTDWQRRLEDSPPYQPVEVGI